MRLPEAAHTSRPWRIHEITGVQPYRTGSGGGRRLRSRGLHPGAVAAALGREGVGLRAGCGAIWVCGSVGRRSATTVGRVGNSREEITGGMSLFSRLVSACTQFANRRGIYAGRRSTKVHVRLYRWSKGRIGGNIPGRRAARILLLEHVGAKSGVHRTSPLIYIADGDAIVVAASKAGQPDHPAWFHNLLAAPNTTIQLGAESRQVQARIANDAERERLWPRFVAALPDYEFYRQHAAHRTIPILILDRR